MHLRIFLTVSVLVLSGTVQAISKDPDLRNFARVGQYLNFQISPDGQHVAAMYAAKDNNFELVIRKKTGDFDVLATVARGRVLNYAWLDNTRILFSSATEYNVRTFRSLIVDINTMKVRPVTLGFGRYLSVVHRLPDDPEHILISIVEEYFAKLYKLKIASAEYTMVYDNPHQITRWAFNRAGKPVLAVAHQDDKQKLMVRDETSGDWSEIASWSDFGNEYLPLYVEDGDKTALMLSRRNLNGAIEDKLGVYRYDIPGQKNTELIWKLDNADIDSGVWYNDDVVGFRSTSHYPQTRYISEQLNEMQVGLRQALPGRMISIRSCAEGLSDCIIHAWNDKTPGDYFWFDLAAFKLTPLATHSPWIDESKRYQMDALSIEARDGRQIPALFVGAGEQARGLIVLVHGGPHAKHSWGYDNEVDFLTQQGFSVLAPNFRGSTGFGLAHLEAGLGQWGTGMIHDIEDATRWAINNGLVDADKVCIMGGSYGGYATMMGLAKTPDLYRCGINLYGLTDLRLMYNTLPLSSLPYRSSIRKMLGNDADTTWLKQNSPKYLADQIKSDVLMIYGESDGRVSLQHAREMYSAMRYKDVDVEFMSIPREGHGIYKWENRVDMYETLQDFLNGVFPQAE